LLKERGAERSGYRGCLVGGVAFGLIGAIVTYFYTQGYAASNYPDMPVFLIPIMFSAVGFVGGAVIGCLVVFLLDLVTRKKENELDEF
jgi:hypothetical protein